MFLYSSIEKRKLLIFSKHIVQWTRICSHIARTFIPDETQHSEKSGEGFDLTCGDHISYRERRLTNEIIGGGGLFCQELLAMYKSRNAPFICPFILRNRNLRNSRNVFSQHLQASFIQPPPLLFCIQLVL